MLYEMNLTLFELNQPVDSIFRHSVFKRQREKKMIYHMVGILKIYHIR